MLFNKRFALRLVESAGLILVITGIIYLICIIFSFPNTFNVIPTLNVPDMYFTQVSVSFIIISLVSVLTNTSKPVYWVDISQYKLIEPQHTAFIDFAAYIFGGLVISTVFLLFSSNYILISFLISVIFMMALTIKMTGAYFGRETVKTELERKYKKLKEDRNSDYDLISNELEYKTYQEIDNKEYQLVRENLELLVKIEDYNRVIDILRYISENMVNIYCRYAEEYYSKIIEYKPKSSKDDPRNRFFQLAYTNLTKSIDENYLQEVSVKLYTILLKGRNEEFTEKALTSEKESSKLKYWLRIAPGIIETYKKCINEGKYDLLNEFLIVFSKELTEFYKMLKELHKNKSENIDELYSLFVKNMGLEVIIRELKEKVDKEQIDMRHINLILNAIRDIRFKLNQIKNNKDLFKNDMSGTEEIVNDDFIEFLIAAYQVGLLDYDNSRFFMNTFRKVSDKEIDRKVPLMKHRWWK